MASPTERPNEDARPAFASTVLPSEGTGGSAALRMVGSLDAWTAADHAVQLDELLDEGYIELRIELDGLLLCTSDGLDLWDDVQHRLDPLGGHLTLAGAHGVVRRVLDVMTASTMHFCPIVEPAAA